VRRVEQFQAVHVRQSEVQHHQVNAAARQHAERLRARAGGVHGVAGSLEVPTDQFPQLPVVLDDQHTRGHTPTVTDERRTGQGRQSRAPGPNGLYPFRATSGTRAKGPGRPCGPTLSIKPELVHSQLERRENAMKWTDVAVGVDGSAPSLAALRWAAVEAACHGSRLRVVHAYRPPWLVEEIASGTRLDTAALAHAEKVLADGIEEARATAPGTEVTGRTVCCHPVPLLMENAGAASLIVVGCRGHGGFGSMLLGSTGLQLATHATGPVVIVRGTTDRGNAPVVVGTNGSAQADIAVGTAFGAAAARGCFLTAVHGYPHPPGAGASRPAEESALRTALDPWREKYPDVPVETIPTPGDAASVLVVLSSTAQLVVVGTRGRGGFAGLMLGSVGQKLIQHAHCPVLIAR
jgi:nucleotide-binding universal stress UspA family protein